MNFDGIFVMVVVRLAFELQRQAGVEVVKKQVRRRSSKSRRWVTLATGVRVLG